MKKINEDVPTNSTGPAIAGTNGDVTWKKRKLTYKQLLKRISLKSK